MRNTHITIHQSALVHNLNVIKSHTKARVLAMVKADAYGHGVGAVVPALLGADGFGVACMSEAMVVKKVLDALETNKLTVLIEGVFSPKEWEQAIEQNFGVVIHCQDQLDWACQLQPPKDSYTNAIWLKYNTGMNRLGFDETEVMTACEKLINAGYRVILTSHFACADDKSNPMNALQIQAFDKMYRTLQGKFPSKILGSLCNSAGIVNFKDNHYDWVRAGIALYGSSPVADVSRKDLKLKAVMTLTAQIIAVHQLKAGDKVSYGGLWTAPTPSTIGIVSIGYGDGYPRTITDGHVLVLLMDTHMVVRCPIVGRVAMDMMAIDLTQLCQNLSRQVDVYTPVILWGDAMVDIDMVAKSANTISYELMCRLTNRPTRQVIA